MGTKLEPVCKEENFSVGGGGEWGEWGDKEDKGENNNQQLTIS